MIQPVDILRPSGGVAPGRLVEAEGGLAGAGVVLVQEWWGLDPSLMTMAERFADAGFRVVVPDLYRGTVTDSPAEAAKLMGALDYDEVLEDVGGAVQLLKRSERAVAVVGFCLGGAVTIAAAARVAGCDAAVCFYGIPPAAVADPGAVRVPIQAHFANEDAWCTPAAVAALERLWIERGVEHELYRYPTQHAFMNPSRVDAYDEDASGEAWDRTISFLLRHIC